MADAEQRRDEGVATGLLDHALTGVDQHDHDVGRGRAGDHVARVLHVAGGVGQDEAAVAGGEVPVGDVDRDALLALGAQAVGQQRQVDHAVAVTADRRLLDLLQLVDQDLLRVVEQPADQRGLAVVHRSGGRDAEQIGGRQLVGDRGGKHGRHQMIAFVGIVEGADI